MYRYKRDLHGRQLMQRTKVYSHRPYLDRVSHDAEYERVFYVIYVGRYNNKHHFSVGTTTDLFATTFRHTSTFPVYRLIYTVPIGSHTCVAKHLYLKVKEDKYDAMKEDKHDEHDIQLVATSPVSPFSLDNNENQWIVSTCMYDDIVTLLLQDAHARFNVQERFEL